MVVALWDLELKVEYARMRSGGLTCSINAVQPRRRSCSTTLVSSNFRRKRIGQPNGGYCGFRFLSECVDVFDKLEGVAESVCGGLKEEREFDRIYAACRDRK